MLFAGGLAASLWGGAADAASAVHEFHIPAKPLQAALVDLANQAGVSMGLSQASACRSPGRTVFGRLSLEAALSRMLAGTGCGYRLLDGGAVEIFVLPAQPAPAARPPPASALSELVVVATRRPTPADRLAYPVSAIDQSTVAAQGLRDTQDLALTTPGMTVTNLGAGRDKILLRGLSDGPLTGRTQSMVGIYLDDVRLTYNAPDPDLKLVDMARVEVLRGPQGALYGSGSLGGVLHLVTEAPDARARSGWLAVSGDTTHGGAPSAGAEGVLNAPAPWSGGALRLVAYREVQGGYIDDPGLGRTNVNHAVRSGVRLTMIQQLDPDWSLVTGGVVQFINSRDTQYGLGGSRAFQRRNHLAEPHDNDFAEAHATLLATKGWGELRTSLATVRHRVVSRYDATEAPPVPSPPGPVAFDDDDDISSLVVESTLAAHADARVQWLAGAFYARTRQNISLMLTPQGPPAVPNFQEARRDVLDEGALFGEATAPLGSRLSLTLGGRLFASRTRVSSRIVASGAADALFHDRVGHAGFAPKAVLAYRASSSLLIYVQAAEGYRAGGVNTTGTPGQVFRTAGASEPYRFYHPDELWSFEAGARAQLLDGRLTARAAIFHAIWNDIQSDELLASGLPFTANIGDGANQGFEFEGAFRTGALRLGAALLLNHPELDKANPAFPARSELGLAGVPRVSGSLTAHYAWDLGGARSLSLDARYAYVGPSHLTFDARTSPRMGGYRTGRIAATLSRPKWSLTLAVENPTDTIGNTFAYGNPFTLRTTTQTTPLRPRSVSLRVERQF
jgi:outer membrane receptor protein involved in Fe transport